MKISKDAQAVIAKKGISGELLFLVIKRFDKDKQVDHYRLVKGGVDEGETSEEAAQREATEEVGIGKADAVEFLDHYEYVGGDVKHEVDVFLLIFNDTNEKLVTDSSNEGGFTIKDAVWLEREGALGKLNFPDEKRMIEKAATKLMVG